MFYTIRLFVAAALIVDYGHDHGFGDSLRGIKQHKYVDSVFEGPGEVDLVSVYQYYVRKNIS